ncbi:MAG: hypothetical protein ACYDEB_02065 [Dehalococcoidia bacterium]
MFAIRDVLAFGAIAGIAAALVLWLATWSRQRGRFLVAGFATAAGFIAWNLTLNHTNATGFNVDAPVVGVSWADAGSGVLAFVASTIALALYEPGQRSSRVVGTAAAAGVVALVLDIFVL